MSDQPRETGTHYLLQALELDNFMLHRQTRLALGKRSVVLITGANGSGKTQVLDALILTMGHHPRRAKKGNIASLIGPYGSKATIKLTLRNPRWGNGRALRVDDEALNKMLDADELTIETRLTPASGVSYKLHCGEKSRSIKQKEIRQILDNVSVKADNKLAFTEEGTVNLFADHSGRNKFELILDTTGLLQYREHLVECLGTINRAVEEIDPMRKRLHLERDYLQTLERNLELIKHRQQLEDLLAALKIERSWSKVQLHEQGLEADTRKVAAKQHERGMLRDRIGSLNQLIEEVRRQLIDRQQSAGGLRTEHQGLLSRQGAIEGELQVRGEAAVQATSRRDRLATQMAELAPPESEGEQGAEAPPIDLALLADPANRHEWELFEAAIALRKAAEAGGVALEGPIYRLLNVPQTQAKVVRAALGRLAYSLVAATPAALKEGKALLTFLGLPGEILLLGESPTGSSGPLKDIPGDGAVIDLLNQQLVARFGETLTLETGELVDGDRGARLDARWVLAPLTGDGPELEALEALVEAGRRQLAAGQDPAQLQELLAYCHAGIEEAETELARLESENEAAEIERKAVVSRLDEMRGELEQQQVEEEDKGLDLGELQGQLARRTGEQESLERVLTLYETDLIARRNRIEEVELQAREVGSRPASMRDLPEVERELDRTAARLDELAVTRVNMSHYEAQKEKVSRMELELAGSSEHLGNLRQDLNRKYEDWYSEVKAKIEVISESVKNLLSGTFEGVQVKVANLLDAARASFSIEVKRRGRDWRDLSQLSGGEKVLTVEALILSLHLLSDSPVHAIDEFTQRLDHENKAYALEMVCRTVEEASSLASGAYRPQFLLLCPDVLGVEFDEELEQIFHRVVICPARIEADPVLAGTPA